VPALSCGIDIGTTNVKVVLASEDGRALHSRSVPTPRRHDGVGPVTDATELVTMLEEMIVDGWRAAGGGEPLLAIAAAGVGEDGVGVDRTLCPTGPAIPWFDTRAVAEAETLRTSSQADPRAGIAVAADRTVAKWLWIRRHRPADLATATQWIALTDFPAVWWSGRPFMSCSLAPRTAAFDVHDRRWLDSMLRLSGAPDLPELLPAGAIVGTLRQGPLRASGAGSDKTLLVAGGHDHPMAASVFRQRHPTAMVDSIGTANLLYGEATGSTAPGLDPLICFSIPPAGGPALACLGVIAFSAMVDSIGVDRDTVRRFLACDTLPGAPGRPAGDQADAGDDTTRVRRVLETASMRARAMRDVIRRTGAPDGPCYATGGWARSLGFVALRASVFGAPVRIVDEPEITGLAAAFAAQEAATGHAPDFEASRTVVAVDPVADWIADYDRLFATEWS
jgi:xylulokinase